MPKTLRTKIKIQVNNSNKFRIYLILIFLKGKIGNVICKVIIVSGNVIPNNPHYKLLPGQQIFTHWLTI